MKLDLEELQQLAERLEKQDKEGIGTRLAQLEQTYADMLEVQTKILDLLTKQGPDQSGAIADALKGLGGDRTLNVTVPKFDIPAPVIHAMGSPAKRLSITPERDQYGHVKNYDVIIKS